MPGRHAIGVEVLCGLEEILEFHPFITTDAWHRRRARQITVRELVNHRIAKDVLVIQHVMWKAHRLGHAPGIMDVYACATGALLGQGRAVVIKLQRHAHHIITLGGELCRHD